MIYFNSLLTITLELYILGIIAVILLPKKMSAITLGIFGSIGSLTLLIFGIYFLFANNSYHYSLGTIPNIGKLTLSVDHLSAFFLIVTAIVALPSSIFSATRIMNSAHRHIGFLAALYLSLLIAIVLVLVTSNVFFFLLAWEVMSILIYLIVNSGEKERPGYMMLAIGEAGTLAILFSLLLLSSHANTLSFPGLRNASANLGVNMYWSIFLLSFFGFGVKGGLIPLNFWFPRAYNATPSAFIPLIAGATLNLAIYGIIRVDIDFLHAVQAGPGVVMLIIGSLTALIGILYATIEDNFKTLLAHSSIENAGIMVTALGASVIFFSTGHKVAASMAFIASLYHLLNHSVFKTLLFMGAGAVEDATGTRSLDRLGGLLKWMPWTGFFVLVGVLSISAMPPFSGFVSEWLTLESLLRSVALVSLGIKVAFIIAGVFLALTAGLTVTCFVRAFAMGFLGMPRSKSVQKAKEATKATLTSMAFLAFTSLALGVLPTYVIPTINRSVAPLTNSSAADALVPSFFEHNTKVHKLPKEFVAAFHDVGAQIGQNTMPGRGLVVMHRGGKKNPVIFAMSTTYMFIMLILLLALCSSSVWLLFARKRKVVYRERWDGGVKHLFPEMTYTATGFAQPVRVLFNTILHPNIIDKREIVAGHFRVAIKRKRQEIHIVDRLILYPISNLVHKIASILAKMHNGKINTYATYALLSLLISLIIASAI